MNNQAQRERAFSEDLDRVVAGQAPGAEFSEDREYQRSLQFARGMAEVPPRISPEFRAALKATLLAKASEESAPSRSSDASPSSTYSDSRRGRPLRR